MLSGMTPRHVLHWAAPRAALRGAVMGAVLLAAVACGDQSTGSGEATDDPSPAPSSAPSSPSSTSEPSATATPSASGGSATPAPARPQACAAVWRAGSILPEGYRGCLRDGRLMRRVLRCSSGQTIFEFPPRFYAVPGFRVVDVGDMATSKKYRRVVRICQG